MKQTVALKRKVGKVQVQMQINEKLQVGSESLEEKLGRHNGDWHVGGYVSTSNATALKF